MKKDGRVVFMTRNDAGSGLTLEVCDTPEQLLKTEQEQEMSAEIKAILRDPRVSKEMSWMETEQVSTYVLYSRVRQKRRRCFFFCTPPFPFVLFFFGICFFQPCLLICQS